MSVFLEILRNFITRMIHFLSFGKKNISNSLNINIKTNTGKTLMVEIDPKWDIRNVKEVVAPRLGLTPEEIKIIFAGKELDNSIVIEECDLGQQSVLHAVRAHITANHLHPTEISKPLSETLADLQTTGKHHDGLGRDKELRRHNAHFFVYCSSSCKDLRFGKLRVRCQTCGSGAFIVDRDPQNWHDVLEEEQISGFCENEGCVGNIDGPTFAQFYFKCAEHVSQSENDYAVPLYLIRSNVYDVPCLACTDVSDPVLVFPCNARHVTCLDCFRMYCQSRLQERRFWLHHDHGYTLACPADCENSFITEIHHFRLLSEEQYTRYQRFGAEEYVLQHGGVLCPQPGCGMGILCDPDCRRVTCLNGCGFVFCRQCLQGYHLGECISEQEGSVQPQGDCQYSVDPGQANKARWEDASKVTIRALTKPCPKCRTPTERDGGCMHMVCTRPQCGFHWCWVCQIEWTRECMGSHWFG